MKNELKIERLKMDDLDGAINVFEAAIPDAFEKEGISHLIDDINEEIEAKKRLLTQSLDHSSSNLFFLVAKIKETIVGTISFGPCNNTIVSNIDSTYHPLGEIGSIYVVPQLQGKGIGSMLINTMIGQLSKQGVNQYCLDSGYKRAQKRWLRKFGPPYKVMKDYWGPNSDHMIWICNC